MGQHNSTYQCGYASQKPASASVCKHHSKYKIHKTPFDTNAMATSTCIHVVEWPTNSKDYESSMKSITLFEKIGRMYLENNLMERPTNRKDYESSMKSITCLRKLGGCT